MKRSTQLLSNAEAAPVLRMGITAYSSNLKQTYKYINKHSLWTVASLTNGDYETLLKWKTLVFSRQILKFNFWFMTGHHKKHNMLLYVSHEGFTIYDMTTNIRISLILCFQLQVKGAYLNGPVLKYGLYNILITAGPFSFTCGISLTLALTTGLFK